MAEHDPHEGGFEPTGKCDCVCWWKECHYFHPPGVSGSSLATTGTDDGESCSDEQEEQMEDALSKDDGSGVEEQFTAYTDSPHMVSEFISQVGIFLDYQISFLLSPVGYLCFGLKLDISWWPIGQTNLSQWSVRRSIIKMIGC